MSFDDINSYRVYLQTFDDTGEYTGDYINITRYVISLGNTGIQIDDSDYDVGVFKNSNLTLKLNNRSGKFNDVDTTESIFNFKRKDALVKICYRVNEYGPECGVIKLDFACGDEVDVFKGLLNDESFRTDANKEDATFKVLGLESILDTTLVNFSSLSVSDSVSEIIYTILNQTEITDILTVSSGNINPALDQDSDAVASLEGQTVREALDEILLFSNSILYIDADDNIIVTDRTASTTSQITFYGQASPNGAENISNIGSYNNGIHRVFNYFQWKDTTTFSQDEDSISTNGLRKKEIDSDIFTDTAKRENFLDALITQFKDKQIEFEISVPLNYNTLALKLLDKINVDYPTPFYTEIGKELPILGLAVLGANTTPLPNAQWALQISSDTDFKILKKKYNFKNHLVTFKLREV